MFDEVSRLIERDWEGNYKYQEVLKCDACWLKLAGRPYKLQQCVRNKWANFYRN
jgi:hypothetical protein